MKASEVTEGGYYWNVGKHGVWISEVTVQNGYVYFDFINDERTYLAAEVPGDFIGPIEPPDDPRYTITPAGAAMLERSK